MTDALKRLAELEAKATKGPWFRPFPDFISIHAATEDQRTTVVLGQMNDPSDGSFVVATRNALPLLLALADAAVERIEALEALAACYRVGRNASEPLLGKLERTKAAYDAALSALAAHKGAEEKVADNER